MLQKYPRIGVKYIEAKANGHAIIDVLNREIGGFIPVKADVSTGGKIARAYAIEPFVTSGNVYLPRGEGCEWVHEYVEEMASFPNGSHDDQVDATTQVLNKLIFFFAELDKFVTKASQHNFEDKPKPDPFKQGYSDDFMNSF
jgi:predicted phage terminase large subunit-like protein